MNRGNDKRNIVRDDADRRYFVQLLADAVLDFEWVLHSWALMTNHFHFVIETPNMGLSNGMKSFSEAYVEYFNKRHERVGHLFQGRFESVLVERESHLLELTRYVVLNPVRARITSYAGDFLWSNYEATAGFIAPPPWLEIDWTLAQFGESSRPLAQEAYRRFVADARGATYDPWEALRDRPCLGSDEFCHRVKGILKLRREPMSLPELDELAVKVAAVFEVNPDQLRTRSQLQVRKAFVLLAVERTKVPLARVADWMHVSRPAAAKMRDVGRLLYATDVAFREKVHQV
jgi:putative transposase